MKLSILVVSRTASLINRLCTSLDRASKMAAADVEILCSWNGTKEEANGIENTSRFNFEIVQNIPYHFSSNMNKLSKLARGDVLMLANDDLILDDECIDEALEIIDNEPNAGLVGAVLRDQKGRLTHAGINFDTKGSAYHLLYRIISADEIEATRTGPVAAVTGAVMWIKKNDFMQAELNENYNVCGEDVELCLEVQQRLKKQVWLCCNAKAIHEAEGTRQKLEGQGANSEDINRLRARVQTFLDQASPGQLKLLLHQQQQESQQLREINNKIRPSLAE